MNQETSNGEAGGGLGAAPLLDAKALIGKTICGIERLKLKEHDDSGFLRLRFSDGTHCLIEGNYGGYTGSSEDEYPTVIFLANDERESKLIACDHGI